MFRIFAEGVAIVVSILLAFAIQAWWEGQQDRESEVAILSALYDEFQQVRSHVNDIQTYNVAIMESAVRLAELSAHPDATVTEHEIDRLLEDQLWYSPVENFSVLELKSVINRGDLARISNVELRSRLSTWPAKLEWIRSSMQDDVEFYSDVLMPYFNQHMSVLQLAHADSQRPGDPSYTYPAPPFKADETISHRDVISNRVFLNLMLQRASILEEVTNLARTPDLPSQLDQTIVILKEELEKLST